MQNETSFSAILAKRYLDKVNIHPFIFPFNPDLPARGIYFPKKKEKGFHRKAPSKRGCECNDICYYL